MDIGYRDARIEDAAELAALFQASFIETFGHLYRTEDLNAFLASHDQAAWQRQIESGDYAIRIVRAGDEAIALAKVGPTTLPVDDPATSIELKQLYILKPWQGEGVAPRLMDWVLDKARASGAERLYLSVWTENHRARKFYTRYGFSFVAPYDYPVGNHIDRDEIFGLSLKDQR
jgi:GNAT superfamily N-acetyltransferase